MGNVFNEIQLQKPSYSWFDLSHDVKTTMNMGDLVPILCQECIPGDKWKIGTSSLLRLMPMVAPIMHQIGVYVHHFFVPSRILWKNWEKFISPPLAETGEPLMPYLVNDTSWGHWPGGSSLTSVGTLRDYMNIPPVDIDDLDQGHINALPFCAYQKIWWEYYRDENLVATDWDTFEDYIDMIDGELTTQTTDRLMTLRKRAWEHDYFTSALPFAQKGDPVTIPIEVTVDADLPVNLRTGAIAHQYYRNTDGAIIAGNTPGIPNLFVDDDTASGSQAALVVNDVGDNEPANLDPAGTLHAVGTSGTGTSTTNINDLRAAYALQRFLEKNARGGTRYTESLLVHFGVRSSDARLQRPEYLGGSRAVMAISEVLQTSETATSPQGTMAGHGVSLVGAIDANYFCEEHGYILSILSLRPKTSYHQGMPKMYTRFTRLDYYWPDFAMLGEEPVTNGEIYWQGNPSVDNETFGYLPRFSEYRYIPSKINSDMRLNLAYWSLHRSFTTLPALNGDFVECTPSARIFAIDPSVAHTRTVIAHISHSIQARRPLPRYGTPGGLI